MSEIIIDGVNVLKCIHFVSEWKNCNVCKDLIKTKIKMDGNHREYCLDTEDISCKYYDNCYYKQLQRLEADNKELTNKLNWLVIAHKSEQEERVKLELALAKINARILNENADDCLLDIKEIIDKVL